MRETWLKPLMIGVTGSLIACAIWWVGGFVILSDRVKLSYQFFLDMVLFAALLTMCTRYYLLTHRMGITRVRNTAKEEKGQWISEAAHSYRLMGATAYYVLCDPQVREQYIENKKKTNFLFVTIDPECRQVVAAQAAWEHIEEPDFLDHILETKATIDKLQAKGIRIEREGHFFTPTFRIIIVDDKKVFVSFYEKDKLGTECPQLQIRADSLLGRWFIQWFEKTKDDAQQRRREMTALSALVTRISSVELEKSKRGLSDDDRKIAGQLIDELRRRSPSSAPELSTTERACLLGVDFKDYADELVSKWSSSTLKNIYIEPDGRDENEGPASRRPLENLVDSKLTSGSGAWVALLGDFGSGKTTFLTKYTATLATRFIHAPTEARLPILVDLGQYAHVESLERLILEQLAQSGVVVAWRFVETLLSEGKAILIFDAFDQMSTSVDRDTLRRNLEKIRALVTQHQTLAIIACRTHFFSNALEQAQLRPGTILFVERWGDPERDEYLKKVVGPNWQGVRDAILSKYRLAELAQTPLFLDMIVTTKAELLSDAVGTASLYRIYTDRWIASEHSRAVLGSTQKSDFMEKLAWKMLKEGRQAIPYGEIARVLQEQVRLTPTELDRIDYEIRACSFLVRSQVIDAFVFVHYSFLEYFVSRFLAKQIKNEHIDEMCEVELSEDVVDLLAQQLDELPHYKLLHLWLEKKKKRFALARRNSARVLRAMSRRAHEESTDEGVSESIRPLEMRLKSTKAKERLDAILGFGWLAPGDRLTDLRGIIEQPSGRDPQELRMASIVLGLRNDRSSISALQMLLRDPKQHFKVRQNAAVALGLMTDRSTLESLKNSLGSDPHHEVRRAVCWAIEMIDPLKAVELLAGTATNDSSEEVRQYAVWALSRIGSEDSAVLNTMKAVLTDPEPKVRLAALQAIERMEGEGALRLAAEAVKDSDESVRSSAQRVTQRLKERLQR